MDVGVMTSVASPLRPFLLLLVVLAIPLIIYKLSLLASCGPVCPRGNFVLKGGTGYGSKESVAGIYWHTRDIAALDTSAMLLVMTVPAHRSQLIQAREWMPAIINRNDMIHDASNDSASCTHTGLTAWLLNKLQLA